MAIPKVPKKPPKSQDKTIVKPISKRKKKKKNYHNYGIFIYRLLRSVHKDLGISKKSMMIMNSLVVDLIEKVAMEAGRLVVHAKKNTMSSTDVQSSVKLLLPGELAMHANMEGNKAVAMYHASTKKDLKK